MELCNQLRVLFPWGLSSVGPPTDARWLSHGVVGFLPTPTAQVLAEVLSVPWTPSLLPGSLEPQAPVASLLALYSQETRCGFQNLTATQSH